MAVTSWMPAQTAANVTGIGSTGWYTDDVLTPLVGTECSSDNGAYAGCNLGTSATSNYLQLTNFNFGSQGIGASDTIDGFEWRYGRFRNGTILVTSSNFRFVKANVIIGNTITITADWPTTETTATHGGSTELGGQSWAQSDVTATNFGIVLWLINGSTRAASAVRNRLVDIFEMRVHYTAAGGGGGVLIRRRNTIMSFRSTHHVEEPEMYLQNMRNLRWL